MNAARSARVNSGVRLLLSLETKLLMKYLLFFLLTLIVSPLAGCCYLRPTEAQETRPTKDSRWKDAHVGAIDIMGFFVMSRGESTDNGNLGVKVVDILPAKCRAAFAEFPDDPQVILQFYRPADHQVLCEVTLSGRSNTSIDRPDSCGSKTGVSVVGIAAINAKDGWVAFDLRK